MSDVYGDSHRKFLQGMMCRRLCTVSEMEELYATCHDMEHVNSRNIASELPGFLKLINSKISSFYLEIREGIDEDDGSRRFALINCEESEICRQAADFKPIEKEFIQKLIGAVVCTDEGVISSITALNLTDELTKPFSKSDAEVLLHHLNEQKLIVEKNGEIWLSALTIMEFTQYIKEMYPAYAAICTLCRQLVIKGTLCEHCNTKLHNHCMQRLLRDVKPQCPQCKTTLLTASTADVSTERSNEAKQTKSKRRRV